VLRLLAENWPEGKEALDLDGNTPLSLFEDRFMPEDQVSDEEKEEIVSLLGGACSQANND
jgi:hypothetical protein